MSKKTSVILIFIGILLGVVGTDFDIPLGNNISFSLPVGAIASAVLLIVGCSGLYKHTASKRFIKIIVLVGIYCGLNLLILFLVDTASIVATLESYVELLENSSNPEGILVDMGKLLEKLVPILWLSVLPMVASLLYDINLAAGLGEVAVSKELGETLKSKGKKAAIFLFVATTVLIIGAGLMLINMGDFMEFVADNMSSSNDVIQPGAGIGFVFGVIVFMFAALPVGCVFGIIGLVAEIKYIIAVGKLISDVERPVNTEVNNDSVIDSKLDNDFSSDEEDHSKPFE